MSDEQYRDLGQGLPVRLLQKIIDDSPKYEKSDIDFKWEGNKIIITEKDLKRVEKP